MRTAVVKASELGDDWRATAHLPPTETQLHNAKHAGWKAGACGSNREPQSIWRAHGRPEVRQAFDEAYDASRKAREEYFK